MDKQSVPSHPDMPCEWCRRIGATHLESDHPLPKGHPDYDAFYDASDDELAYMISEADVPGRRGGAA